MGAVATKNETLKKHTVFCSMLFIFFGMMVIYIARLMVKEDRNLLSP